MTLIYLAEPIDQLKNSEAAEATNLFGSLNYGGFTIYRPSTAWKVSELEPRLDQINREALYRADCLVAYLPAGVPSIGVPAEIEAATARGIPAVVLTDVSSQALVANPRVTVIDKPSQATAAVLAAVKQRVAGPDGAIRLILNGADATLPGRAYDDDAGIDLACIHPDTIWPGKYADLYTQVVGTQLPAGYWGFIIGRSSTLRKHGLQVNLGVIDPGWRGPLLVGVYNPGSRTVQIEAGMRLAQLILIPNHPAPIVSVDEVDPHPRGTNGFGSSGT